MSFPTPFKMRVEDYIPDTDENAERDAHGNAIESWGPPREVAIIGYGIPEGTEPPGALSTLEVIDLQAYILPGFMCEPKSRVEIVNPLDPKVTGRKFRSVGMPTGTEGNPFGWVPGGVLNLKHWSGGS